MLVLATSGAVLLSVAATMEIRDDVTFQTKLAQDAAIQAEIVARNTNAALAFRDPAAARETLDALEVDGTLVGATLFDKDGQVFAAFRRKGTAAGLVPPLPVGSTLVEDGRLFASRPVSLGDDVLGTVLLEFNLGELEARRVQSVVYFGLVFLGMFFPTVWLAGRVQRLVTGPIVELAGVARRYRPPATTRSAQPGGAPTRWARSPTTSTAC